MKYLIFILILSNILVYYIIFDYFLSENLVAFLNVWQGSSVFIKEKNNSFLYDTGKNSFLLFKELDRFLPFYRKRIDILFLSHPDKDHYQGAFDLLKRYQVRMVIISTLKTEDLNYLKLIKELQKRKIPLLVLKKGDLIKTKENIFLILHPDKKYQKDNNNSLVIKLINKKSFLLTGDIEKLALENLINCCLKILKSNYLLVPHHGSKSSLVANFYKIVNPDLVVIQVGKNYYGHPHQEVLNFFQKNKLNFWRTDENGTLVIK